jgi:hypothetical protein
LIVALGAPPVSGITMRIPLDRTPLSELASRSENRVVSAWPSEETSVVAVLSSLVTVPKRTTSAADADGDCGLCCAPCFGPVFGVCFAAVCGPGCAEAGDAAVPGFGAAGAPAW